VVMVREAGADASVQSSLLNEISGKLVKVHAALKKVEETLAEAGRMKDQKDKAFFFKDEVRVAMGNLRKPVDELEMLVDKEVWPIPSYGDLIFEV